MHRIYAVHFTASEWSALEARTPEYNKESAQERVLEWWHAQYLRGRRLDVTVHLTALLTPTLLTERFLSLQTPPSLEFPAKGYTVLVGLGSREIYVSRDVARKLRVPVDTLRRAVLHSIILDVYGVSREEVSA